MKPRLHNIKSSIQRRSFALTVIIALSLLAGYIFVQAYPFRTVEVKSITVNQEEIKAGDEITYSVDQCRFYNGESDVDRTLIDVTRPESENLDITLNADKGVPRKKGCYQFKSQRILIPAAVPSGLYRIKFHVTHHLFWGIRTIENDQFSSVFPVLNPKDANDEAVKQILRDQVDQYIEDNPGSKVEGNTQINSNTQAQTQSGSSTPSNPPPEQSNPTPEQQSLIDVCVKAGGLLSACIKQ